MAVIDIWQMYLPGREPINQPLRPWTEALDLPMATQMIHLKQLMLSRPVLRRIPDPSMLNEVQEEGQNYKIATRDSEGTYGMVYYPLGGTASLNLSAFSGDTLNTWWYDPRTGAAFPGETHKKSSHAVIEAPTSGLGNDWVLVIDVEGSNYPTPGNAN